MTGTGAMALPSRNGTGSHPPRPAPAAPARRRRRWPWVLLGLLVLAAAAAAVLAATGVLGSAEQRPIPTVVGKDVGVATRQLRTAGFDVRAVRRRSVRPRDRVIKQEPGG